MDITQIATIFSVVLSIAAFIISAVALWQTHFSKFQAISTVGNLRLRIYPIRSNEKKWYIPSIDVPISITNEGARSGKILGLRVCVSFPKLPIPDNYEIFIAKWDVDYKKFEPISRQRFEWIKKAVIGEWMSFVILPKQTVTKHFIFESRWDEPVIQDKIDFDLEIYTDTFKHWQKIGKWRLKLGLSTWSELTVKGTSLGCYEVNAEALTFEQTLNPPDLHKYTGTKKPIPESGFQSEPSYLDYPESKEPE